MIIQPCIENSIWHGLMNKETGPRDIWIRIKDRKDKIHFTVEDNGIGMNQQLSFKEREEETDSPRALDLIKHRIELIKARSKGRYSFMVKEIREGETVLGTQVQLVISKLT